jgi:hypothetical protein
MDNLILGQQWGGLGDNLQFSTLPELYSKVNKEVYISSSNVVRNTEIKEIVWDKNPFIKGTLNLSQNIGGHLFCSIPKSAWEKKCNIIKKWELVHGFNSDDDFPLPKIYYKPNLLEAYSNKIVADFTATTLNEHYSSDLSVIKNYTLKNYNKNDFFILRPSSKNIQKQSLAKSNFEHQVVEYSNIFEYADIIFSAKRFVCFYSGGMVLGSALRKSDIDCIFPPHPDYYIEHEMPYYYFPNVKYIETLKK